MEDANSHSLPLPYSQIPKSERKTKQNRRNTRPYARLSGSGESLRELPDVGLELAVAGQELDVSTVGLNLTSLTLGDVLLALERGETPVLGDDDLLATREPVKGTVRTNFDMTSCVRKNVLVLRTPEGLNGGSTVRVTGADRQKNLANVDTGNSAVGLTPGTTHTGLETISSGTRQHLVDTDNVVRMSTIGPG